MDYTRRRAVAAAGSAITLGLAGCLGGGGDDEPYDGYLGPANNFDGVADRTGESEVTVAVGANSGLSFDPAAVKISPETTVVWEWTGRGGQHNVVTQDGRLESDTYFDEGETFSHTFEEPGIYEYYCAPHRGQGMLGVVEVIES